MNFLPDEVNQTKVSMSRNQLNSSRKKIMRMLSGAKTPQRKASILQLLESSKNEASIIHTSKFKISHNAKKIAGENIKKLGSLLYKKNARGKKISFKRKESSTISLKFSTQPQENNRF